MRTWRKGVEDETLSCGTGVTAAALSLAAELLARREHTGSAWIHQGTLRVHFTLEDDGSYRDIWLTGPGNVVQRNHTPAGLY